MCGEKISDKSRPWLMNAVPSFRHLYPRHVSYSGVSISAIGVRDILHNSVMTITDHTRVMSECRELSWCELLVYEWMWVPTYMDLCHSTTDSILHSNPRSLSIKPLFVSLVYLRERKISAERSNLKCKISSLLIKLSLFSWPTRKSERVW